MRSLLLLALALPACSDSPDPNKNPTTLWLAPNGDERHAKLVDFEPPPW
ncbi:MAG TPA: hypothetical protein VIX73_22820 [Kofleriaceae bacterium]|jgi:hypothetical protein